MKRKMIHAIAAGCLLAIATFAVLWNFTNVDIIRMTFWAYMAYLTGCTMAMCTNEDNSVRIVNKNVDKSRKDVDK